MSLRLRLLIVPGLLLSALAAYFVCHRESNFTAGHKRNAASEVGEPPRIVSRRPPLATEVLEKPTSTAKLARPVEHQPSTPRDEATLMAMLRALGGSHPALSLKLAREGESNYPNSPDAPERRWYVIRGLVDVGQFKEAVAEARELVSSYPETPFASDVARHLLTHPMTHPTEVGFNEPDR